MERSRVAAENILYFYYDLATETGDWCIATSSLHLDSCDRLLEREK